MRHGGESVQGLPLPADLRGQLVLRLTAGRQFEQPIRLVARLLGDTGLQPDRRRERLAAEADVDQEASGLPGNRHGQHVVGECGQRCVGFLHPHHPPGQPVDAVPQLVEGVSEESVVLVAVAATAAGDELVEQRRGTEIGNRDAQQRVEVLERDRPAVRGDDGPQGGGVRLHRALVADPAEVAGQVECRVSWR